MGCDQGSQSERDDWPAIAALLERYADVSSGGTDASIAVLADSLGTDLRAYLDHRHVGLLRARAQPTGSGLHVRQDGSCQIVGCEPTPTGPSSAISGEQPERSTLRISPRAEVTFVQGQDVTDVVQMAPQPIGSSGHLVEDGKLGVESHERAQQVVKLRKDERGEQQRSGSLAECFCRGVIAPVAPGDRQAAADE